MRYVPMATTGSTDSTTAPHVRSLFNNTQLVQSFPRHDTIKLDNTNFVQWKQHIHLITDGYDLIGFLDGSLPILPLFVPSSDGSLVLNPDASAYFQQDKFIASWLLSTKGFLSIKEYLVKVEKVEIVLVGLPPEFDAVLTIASFLSEPLHFQRLVEVLLEYESQMTRAVQKVPPQAHLVDTASALVGDAARGGRPPTGRGRGFHSRSQCQICGQFDHLAHWCYYRFNRDYSGPALQSSPADYGSSTDVGSFGNIRSSRGIRAPYGRPSFGHYDHGASGPLHFGPNVAPTPAGPHIGPHGVDHKYGQDAHTVGLNNGRPHIGSSFPVTHLALPFRPSGPVIGCVQFTGLVDHGSSSQQFGDDTLGPSLVLHWIMKPRACVHPASVPPIVGLPRIPDYHSSNFSESAGTNINTA
ncbi:hypothetical protein J1N35_001910 [Gossypium stocksii]|uniref:Retrotransposon Copia-like N-terminal domain-containing protein n=1 Tax=Gossypium stocksii TaxID=47602 RepID=A0A9D4ALS9_9ROSI|nr:hypothetical protein J1N35_001910 [Gossypium stocksii]